MLVFLSLLSLVVQILCQRNYTGHKVLSLIPRNEKEVKFLTRILKKEKIDVWTLNAAPNEKTYIRVPPEVARKVEKKLRCKHIAFKVITDNLQAKIDEERRDHPHLNLLDGTGADLKMNIDYYSFDDIMSYLDLVKRRHKELAEVHSIGTTYEQNPIKGLKIGSPGEHKPAIWMDFGIHAREWIAPAISLYYIEKLVKGYDTDPKIKQYLDTYDWYIFPVANPDGYKYTWTHDRLWRKNRFPSGGDCIGTDPNRNFDINFGGQGSDSDPCSEAYHGKSAFSEDESRAIRDGVLKLGDTLKVYITYHSLGQFFMSPYGYKKEKPPDYKDHMKAMKAATNAIENVSGKKYEHGTITDIITKKVGDSPSGSATDWAYAHANVKYSFAVELRDTGENGFMLPKNQIIPTAKENFAGFIALLDTIHSEIAQ